jgi:hypothetical protein
MNAAKAIWYAIREVRQGYVPPNEKPLYTGMSERKAAFRTILVGFVAEESFPHVTPLGSGVRLIVHPQCRHHIEDAVASVPFISLPC